MGPEETVLAGEKVFDVFGGRHGLILAWALLCVEFSCVGLVVCGLGFSCVGLVVCWLAGVAGRLGVNISICLYLSGV